MSDINNSHPAEPGADATTPAAAATGRNRNLAIITGGVVLTLCIIGYLIYSETPAHTPINIAAPFQYLPNDTTTVLYINGRELWGGIKESGAEADAVVETSVAVSSDPDELFAQTGAQTAAGLTLLDQVKGLREVEHVLVSASRGAAMPTLVVAPFREPEVLMNNLKSLPGFSSSHIIVDKDSGWPVMQVKLAWQKLIYLSAAEDQYLFVGDGTYFLKTLRGFQRPVKAGSFQGGPVEPLLADVRPGTLMSVVQVISLPDDLTEKFDEPAAGGGNDAGRIALLRAIEEVGVSLKNMQAIRMDVWRREGDAAMMIEVSLLFSRPEFGEAFQRNTDQARDSMTVLAGILLPRDVGVAFSDLAIGMASPRQTGRVVTFTIDDSPAKINAFLSATATWLEGRMNLTARFKDNLAIM